MLLVFLLDVVVGGEPGPRRRDQGSQRDSTPRHFEEFGENLEEEEESEEVRLRERRALNTQTHTLCRQIAPVWSDQT